MARGLLFSSVDKLLSHPEWIRTYQRRGYNNPLTLEVDPTNRCPLRCPHCVWRNLRRSHGKAELSTAQLKSILRDAARLGVKSIVWTGGGEPLAHPELASVLAEASSLGLKNGMLTSGALLTPELSKALLPHLSWIRFHMDGATADAYGRAHGVSPAMFHRVVDNIATFAQMRRNAGFATHVGLGAIATTRRLEPIAALTSLTRELGLDYFQLKHDLEQMSDPTYLHWWDAEAVPRLASLERELADGAFSLHYSSGEDYTQPTGAEPCHAHWLSLAITADGRVCFCKFLRHREDLTLGNLREAPLADILAGERRRAIFERVNTSNCGFSPCTYAATNSLLSNLTRGAAHAKLVPEPCQLLHSEFL